MSRFRVTDGPYAGDYDVDPDDFTGSEANAFRAAVGCSLQAALSAGGIDVDSFAGLVWIVRRRQSRALPYQAVADNITRRSIQPASEDEEADQTDPSSSGAG